MHDAGGPTNSQRISGKDVPLVRTALTGLLMGLANLVPGVSGGTMVVVMGLYDEFVSAIADATRLQLRRHNLRFLLIVGGTAVVSIGLFSGPMARAVALQREMMFSLFIGMTLGGVPLLWNMLQRVGPPMVCGSLIGFALMLLVAMSHTERPNKEAVRAAAASGALVVTAEPVGDLLAGALGMSAMVLPGVSGAYMLLIVGRYEPILVAVSLCKTWLVSGGGDARLRDFLPVLLPVGMGSILGLLLLSNVLRWMLHRHSDLTIGLLLGILAGSVVGIWPFSPASAGADYAGGAAVAVAGLAATTLLARIKR